MTPRSGSLRRVQLAVVTAALVVSTLLSCAPDEPANLVLITVDTTRRDDLEIYGGDAATPALARLATDGILLDNLFSVAYGTSPSHASLFTSLHAREHGMYNNRTVLPETLPTLAEVLRERGYATAAFVSAGMVGRRLGFDRGFETMDDSRRFRRGDLTAALAVSWIGSERQPFFAWLHLYDPHQPYDPPPEYAKQRLADLPEVAPGAQPLEPVNFARLVYPKPYLEQGPAVFEWVERHARARYLAEIEFMDAQIGRVVDHLDQLGLYENTLIAVVSDHGENFADQDPGLAFFHTGLHRDVALLAGILKLPGSRRASQKSSCLMGNLDVAPTLLDLLGLVPPTAWSGRNAVACLRQDSQPVRDHLVLEGAHRYEWSVRTPRWAYREIRDPRRRKNLEAADSQGFGPGELVKLHDLARDPMESRNVATLRSPGLDRQLNDFRRLLADFDRNHADAPAEPLTDPEHLEALRTLGYVD